VRPGLCLLLAVLTLGSCSAAPSLVARDLPPPRVVSAVADGEVTANVLELFCQSCAERIIAGSRGIAGVTAVDVDRREKLLTIHFDSQLTSRERILAALDDVVSSIP